MDIQVVLVVVIFLAAVYYIGRLAFRAFNSKQESCNTGCAKCSVNFEDVKNQ